MKMFLIGPNNDRFEAEIVRYFENVNDHYLIYTKGEKDANGYVLLYATKVVSDSGIRVGENITDENEWALIKSFLQKTVSENKEKKPVSINDSNPVEVNELKINAQRPFKLSEASAELFGQNKKDFEIVQKKIEEQNTVKVPVPPEVTEFVNNDINVSTADSSPEAPVADTNLSQNVEAPAAPTSVDNTVSTEAPVADTNLSQNVEAPTAPTSVDVPVVPQVDANTPMTLEEPPKVENNNYEEMYKFELEKNESLTKEIEQLIKDNAQYKEKLDKIKELLG